MVIDTSFLKSLDHLQIILKRRVHADQQGERHASAMGHGLVFQDYKMYVPGDDFRDIDCNVDARTDKFFIKRFEEERNLVVHILVDSSGSMDYGRNVTKFEYASQVGMGFAYMAMRKNEKFTFATFTDDTNELPPRKGTNQMIHIVDLLSKHKVKGASGFKSAMESYKKNIHGRSLIVLISDFLYDLDEVREVLHRYQKSEVFVIQILDPVERELSLSGDVILEDAESDEKMRTFVSRRLKSVYQDKLSEHIYKLKDICEETDASFISVTSDTPIFETFYHTLK